MKLKISWPTGIILSISLFVIFILTFVYKVMFLPEYDHHLVSEDYYKEELNYQQEIDKLNNAAELPTDVELHKTAKGLEIIFPESFDPASISGTISFKRLSNDKIDFTQQIVLTNPRLLIPDERLVPGRWNVRIDWKVAHTSYLLKEKITY